MWPRSHDLIAELPALAYGLGILLVRVSRVPPFSLEAWPATPRRIILDGGTVRLEGFGSEDADVVHVSGSDLRRLSLLVVPPETVPVVAHDAMTTAASRGNAERPGQILAASGVPVSRSRRLPDDDAQSRWGTDGGGNVDECG